MSIKMDLGKSQAQSDSVKKMCQAQMAGYQALQQSIQVFANDTESLKGKAYDSARAYFSTILLPLAQGSELYAESLQKAIAKLPEEYQARVDTKSWDEEDLLRLIRQEEEQIHQLEAIYESISRLEISRTEKQNLRRTNTDLIRGHQANKRVYEVILEDLRVYDTYSATLFEELEEIDLQLQRGLAQAERSWDSKSKTFTLPSDLSWSKRLSAYAALKDLTLSKQDKVFLEHLMTEYGFDSTTARQILKLKQGLERKFSSIFDDYTQEERDYLLLRIIGSVSYNGVKWDETAGYLSRYFYKEVVSNPVTGEKQKVPKSLLDIFQELGLSKAEAKQLQYNLSLQHEMAGGDYGLAGDLKKDFPVVYENSKKAYKEAYGTTEGFDQFWNGKLKAYSNDGKGNADFTHQSITMATHLNPASIQLSDIYGGREHVKDLAGWEGDTTYNANDRAPSIGEDDYKADLDAVNIIGRMKKGQSYQSAMSSYYSDVQKGQSVREKEFLKNKDWDKVKKTIYDSLVPNGINKNAKPAVKDYIAQIYPDVSKFLNRLEAVAGGQ
ncbi:T7SS effector LXG polymorphic toxin [Streptococcus intermedius]|uniref:T7SS effector LXG polymorphic toxin n=1 Tax=Streptococcus intermedius TaxID=1338 RepID=UPI000E3E3C6C|nr:T7SS effector LXG polymorphic toxin [Streptococcus intermedius]